MRIHRAYGTVGRLTVLAVGAAAILMLGLLLKAEEKRPAPERLEPGKSCTADDCHKNLKGAPVVHSPVKEDACDMCHTHQGDLHKFAYPATGERMCIRCHKEFPHKKFVHEPIKDKDAPCTTCHNPHGSKNKHLLVTDTVNALCVRCHRETVKGDLYHTPEKVEQGCSACHEPHSTDAPKMLRSAPPGLCLTCHKNIEASIAGGAVVHGPMNTGCATCHNPHQVRAGKGLIKTGPALCLSCHSDLKPTVAAMEVHHKVPLQEGGCGRCHDPHAAPQKSLLRGTSEALCLVCHKDDRTTHDDRTLPGLGAVLVSGARVHGALAEHNCGGCHDPHGSQDFSFLIGAYPPTMYAPYKAETYAACFKCHDPSLAVARQTTSATKFRNGDVNLHFVHVNNQAKGRTCRMCHAPHASNSAHLIRDTLPFGEWKMPIGYTASDTGGSCASGCHLTKSYDRTKPVVYARPTAPPAPVTPSPDNAGLSPPPATPPGAKTGAAPAATPPAEKAAGQPVAAPPADKGGPAGQPPAAPGGPAPGPAAPGGQPAGAPGTGPGGPPPDAKK